MKNLELKFYEKIGIRKFRDILIKFIYLLAVPLYIIFKIPKEKRKTIFRNSPSNYFMKKGNGLKDLKDFKKWLYFNSAIHIYALLKCIMSIINGAFIFEIPHIILNLYCIMLQRYNYIRINNTIKKYEEIEKKKTENLKEEIKSNIEKPHISIYIPKKKFYEKDKTIDSMLENLSLKSLKELKYLIERYQLYNSKYLYVTFEEKKQNYELRAKVKQKNR